ncbi:uncharacterized protein LOC134290964 [Aedes albopictus]|uniref:Peptidase aspartic putative domain-containing protein n=1 Tax=Aedes albopictus TaxID=7160 RepID=A0ABM1YTL2_AEDAL
MKLGLDDKFLVLQNTKLGWVVSGGYKELQTQPISSEPSCLLVTSNETLSEHLRLFWELEEYINTPPHYSDEEIRCEEHFAKHTNRDYTGRFVVRLPFSKSPVALGKSRDIAEKRMHHLERMLERYPKLREQYHTFIQEYIDLGHMSLATSSAPDECVFLPHHCVVKEASSKTKCRVVFDASAKAYNGKSLNDILMTGPVLQDSLVNILLRFRFPSVVAGDVRQIYRNCRILCRWSKEEPLLEYCLNTVTYGTKSASYPATKFVQQLLLSHEEYFPETVQRAIKGTYVEDVLTGAENIDEAKQLRQELCQIFAAGGFHLRKWASFESKEYLKRIAK